MKFRILIPILCTALSVGCEADRPSGGDGGTAVATSVSGYLQEPELLPDAAGSILKFDDESIAFAETVATDEDGRFQADLGAAYGAMLASFESDALLLETFFIVAQAGDEVTAQVSPITTLGAAYARYLRSDGQTPEVAISRIEDRLFLHFGALAHQSLKLEAFDGGSVTDAQLGYFLNEAFGRLSALLASRGGQDIALAPTSSLISLLAQDIRADGVFDGKGTGGSTLRHGGTELSGDTLRRDFALALALMLDESYDELGSAGLGNTIDDIATRTSPIFPGESAPLDRTAPVITFEVPEPDQVIAGILDIRVLAADESELATLRFDAPAAIVDTEPTFGAGGQTAELLVSLESATFADGQLELTASASDAFGNTAKESVRVVVDNFGPVIIITSPSNGETVTGVISVEANATDDDGIASLFASEPATLVDLDPSFDRFRANWDTTALPEGPANLRLEAYNVNGTLSEAAISIDVDNFDFGTLRGFVALDAPIRGAEVRAYAYSDDAPMGAEVSLCEESSCLTNQNGEFAISIQDTHSGPIMVEVRGSTDIFTQSLYQDAARGADVQFTPENRLTYLVTQYEPGATPPQFTVNALTSFEFALVESLRTLPEWRAGSLEETANYARGLLSQHIRRPESLNFRATSSYNIRQISSASPSAGATLLGLIHAGLARLGSEAAIDASRESTITSAEVVMKLEQDLIDGVFDGLSGAQGQLSLAGPGTELSVETLRCDLARAISRFLEPGQTSSVHPVVDTNLTIADFVALGGFFDDLCTDESVLFGEAAGEGYDQEAPVMVLIAPQDEVVTARYVDSIEIIASDNTGVSSINLVSPTLSLIDNDSDPNRFYATNVDLSSISQDGVTYFRFVARDIAGNDSAYLEFPVIVDRGEPEITITKPIPGAWVNAGETEVQFSVDEPYGLAELSIRKDQGITIPLSGLDLSGNDFTTTMSFTEFEGQQGNASITVGATDVAGQTGDASTSVFIDGIDPLVTSLEPEAQTIVAGDFTLLVTATDTQSGLASLRIVSPEDFADCDSASSIGTLRCQVSADLFDVSQPFVIEATDLVGRVTTEIVQYRQDSDAPTVEMVDPVSGTYVKDQSVTVRFRVTDPRGIEPSSVKIEGATATAEGSDIYSGLVTFVDGATAKTITVEATDTVGNTVDPSEQSFVIYRDFDAPALSLLDVVDGQVLGIQSGGHRVRVSATDRAMKSLRWLAPSALTSSAATTEVMATGSSVETLELDTVLYPGQPGFESGTYQFRFQAEDAVGNIEDIFFELTLDSDAPVITLVTPEANSFTNSRLLTVSGQIEDLTSITSLEVTSTFDTTVDETLVAGLQGFNSFTADVDIRQTPSSVISERIFVVARDEAGNEARYVFGGAEGQPIIIDRIAPTQVEFRPEPGVQDDTFTFNNDGSIRITFEDAELIAGSQPGAGVTTLELYLRGADDAWVKLPTTLPSASPACPEKCVFVTLSGASASSLDADGNGIVDLKVVASDAAGNVTERTGITFRIDTTDPIISGVTPEDGALLSSSNITMLIDVSNEAGGSEIASVTVGGEPASLVDSRYQFAFDAGDVSVITKTIRVADAVGNSTQETVTYSIDEDFPVPSVILPVSGSVHGESVTVKYQCADANLVSCSLVGAPSWLASANFVENMDDPTLWIYTADVPLAGVADGDYSFEVRAQDVGQSDDSNPITFTVDRTAPVVSLVASTLVATDTMDLSVSFADATEQIGTIEILKDNVNLEISNGATAVEALPGSSNDFLGVRVFSGDDEDSAILKARVTDAAGNVGTAEVSVSFDPVVPAIEFESVLYEGPDFAGYSVSESGTVSAATSASTLYVNDGEISFTGTLSQIDGNDSTLSNALPRLIVGAEAGTTDIVSVEARMNVDGSWTEWQAVTTESGGDYIQSLLLKDLHGLGADAAQSGVTVALRAVDDAGNIGDAITASVTFDLYAEPATLTDCELQSETQMSFSDVMTKLRTNGSFSGLQGQLEMPSASGAVLSESMNVRPDGTFYLSTNQPFSSFFHFGYKDADLYDRLARSTNVRTGSYFDGGFCSNTDDCEAGRLMQALPTDFGWLKNFHADGAICNLLSAYGTATAGECSSRGGYDGPTQTTQTNAWYGSGTKHCLGTTQCRSADWTTVYHMSDDSRSPRETPPSSGTAASARSSVCGFFCPTLMSYGNRASTTSLGGTPVLKVGATSVSDGVTQTVGEGTVTVRAEVSSPTLFPIASFFGSTSRIDEITGDLTATYTERNDTFEVSTSSIVVSRSTKGLEYSKSSQSGLASYVLNVTPIEYVTTLRGMASDHSFNFWVGTSASWLKPFNTTGLLKSSSCSATLEATHD